MNRPYGLPAILLTAAVAGAVGLGVIAPTAQRPTAYAQDSASTPYPDDRNAHVVDAFGTVARQLPGLDRSWKPVNVGDTLAEQTTLRTGPNGAALLQLPKGHLMRVGSGTTVLLRQLNADNQFSFKVLSGQVWSMVRKANHPAKYEVETPSGVAGVTGTIFSVSADSETGESMVSTDEGSVVVRQGGQSAPVVRGSFFRLSRRMAGPFLAQPQTPSIRAMWHSLHGEGILSRRFDTTPGLIVAGAVHLHRDLEPGLYHAWFGNRGHRDQNPYGLAPTRGPLPGSAGRPAGIRPFGGDRPIRDRGARPFPRGDSPIRDQAPGAPYRENAPLRDSAPMRDRAPVRGPHDGK